ncbi:DUF4350 domain-containing protein [Sorangium sp. So ce1128]
MTPERSREPEGDKEAIFRRRTAVALAAVCAVSLAAALLIAAFYDGMDGRPVSWGANAFSRSALGYRALVLFLERSGVPVVVSRHASAERSGKSSLLLVAEPPAGDEEDTAGARFAAMARDARVEGLPLLVVLPKWKGRPIPLRPEWIERAELRPLADVTSVLGAATGESVPEDAVVRLPVAPDKPFSATFPGGKRPALPAPQLLRWNAIDPIVWTEAGVLISRSARGPVYIVSDPDLFNTSGLARGDNALVAEALFTHLRAELRSSSVIVDETLHGFQQAPSLWAELAEFPLVLVTLHLAALSALALWAMMGRFGAKEPAPPRLPPGKRALIDNTAELLGLGGHSAHSLRHYFQMTVRAVAAAYGLPQGLSEDETIERLSALGQRRGSTVHLEDLRRRVLEAGSGEAHRPLVLDAAAEVFRFRKEMIREHR